MSSSSSSPSSSPTTSTSNNCKQYSPDELNAGAAMSVDSTENQEKKVCFICGSHTTQFINIYERRCGPNMIDVISEKFKMRPLNDDKFLCYSCNNWLINWYSMQKKKNNTKNHDSSNEDAAQQTKTSSSTMSAANMQKQQTAKTSADDTQCYDTNEMVIISDDDDEYDENIDVNNIVQTLRNRLKKYLYYPNRPKSNNQDEWQPIHPDAALVEFNRSIDNDRNCRNCGKLFRKRLNRHKQRTCCRSCRFLMRRYGNSTTVSYKFHKNQLKSSQFRENVAHIKLPFNENRHSRVLTTNHHVNIFRKLQQLGTSIYYENEYQKGQQEQHEQWRRRQQQQHIQQKNYHLHRHHMTSIPHEIDMKSQKNGTKTWQQRQNGSNEILMTFNTVVTEVFPIDELYGKFYGRSTGDQISNESETNNAPNNFNIQEILRNVPKSLTITIAQ